MISGQHYYLRLCAIYDDSAKPAMRVQVRRGRLLLDRNVPDILRPLIRAYLLGYASSTVPRLLTLLITRLSKRRKSPQDGESFGVSVLRILRGGLEWQRFPTFCAALVGGSTLLQARDPSPSYKAHY